MGWPKCNTTLEYESINEVPLWKSFTFHRFGLILSAVFGLIAVVASVYLIYRHATHYLKPWEQRHIIRVLFMVPIYSTVSFLSYLFYRHAVYFEVLRDCYEAFAIASFFSLLCNYIAPDLHSQKDYFRGLTPRPWVWPLSQFKRCCGGGEHGWLRTPRSGLTLFNILWLGVFQYCFIRVFMTIVAVITQAAGKYCLESLNPAFAHVWVMVIEGICVSIAMYCIIQFYLQIRFDIAEHRPFLKLLSIKLVIFLSFWQTLLISFLTSSGAIKPSPHLAAPDIKIGIPSLLLCIEMSIFSILHLWAFPWRTYDINRSSIVAAESGPGFLPDPKTAYKGGPMGIKALLDAFNPWDLVKAVGRAFKWLVIGRKKREQDVSYKNHIQGTGLEPTRGSNASKGPIDHNATFVGGKPGRYQPLDGDDQDRILSHAQPLAGSNLKAAAPYSLRRPDAPDARYHDGDLGSMGTAGRYNEDQDHLRTMHPTPGTMRRGQKPDLQETGIIRERPIDEQDTGYHGASLTPAPSYPGKSEPDGEEGWNVWSGHHGDGKSGDYDGRTEFDDNRF